MAKLFISSLIFLVALQITCYLFWAFNFFGGLVEYPLGDISSLQTLFVVDKDTIILAIIGGTAIGFASLILRQGINAVYATIIWAVGCMFTVFRTFFLAIPNTIGALFPPETNPNPVLFPINPFVVVISFVFLFGAWWFFFGLVVQRDQT